MSIGNKILLQKSHFDLLNKLFKDSNSLSGFEKILCPKHVAKLPKIVPNIKNNIDS